MKRRRGGIGVFRLKIAVTCQQDNGMVAFDLYLNLNLNL